MNEINDLVIKVIGCLSRETPDNSRNAFVRDLADYDERSRNYCSLQVYIGTDKVRKLLRV